MMASSKSFLIAWLLCCAATFGLNSDDQGGTMECDVANDGSSATFGLNSDDQGDPNPNVANDGSCINPDTVPVVDCNVYMAPSTLGDTTNLGIYTAKDLKPAEIVNWPEIAIPLLFRSWQDHPPYSDGDGKLWDRYIWEGDVANIESYDDTDLSKNKAVFVPGVGCTVNSQMDMSNIHSTHGSVYDTAGVRRDEPGSGAFSPYHSAVTSAMGSVEAGSELFASYGESWIPWIEGAQVTFNEYLDQADEFLDEYMEWLQTARTKHTVTPQVEEALWKLTKDFPIPARVFSVLPRTDWKTVEQALVQKTASVHREFIRNQGKHTLEWLQEHGKCQDHLRPGTSSIPQAGRGAFAARNLPKGTVVGYAPLIHIGEKAMDLWNIKYPAGYNQTDLVINYSFGHSKSSLLLTPYGGMVNYINHDKSKANVKVVWPSKPLAAHVPEWLEEDVQYLRNTVSKIGLSFDYIALREIQEGEEVVMDYGDEWQAAWDEHVQTWTPPEDADSYVHSSKYPLPYFRTVAELEKDAYPPNLHTLCIESFRKAGDTFEFIPVLRESTDRVYCMVVERQALDAINGIYTYTVDMKLASGESIRVHKVTTQGLFLYDKIFTNDWHLPNAFRHAIMVPDEIFPENWKNKS